MEAYDVAASVCGADVLPETAPERRQSEALQADYRGARRGASVRRPAKAPAAGSEWLQPFYLQSVRPFLMGDGRDGELATADGAARAVAILPRSLQDTARELAEIAAERRDLVTQERLHVWLHAWLLVHVPLTVVLFVLLGAHAWWALRYSTVCPSEVRPVPVALEQQVERRLP
jgi:hypothetical protein